MKYTKAKDLMNTDVRTAQVDWTLDDLAEFLLKHEISGAPVVDAQGALKGVVSLTDVARHRRQVQSGEQEVRPQATYADQPADEPSNYYRSEAQGVYGLEDLESLRITDGPAPKVRDIMTPEVYDVNEHTSVQQVASIMLRSGIHRVFVTKDDQVEGVVTTMDMLKVVQEL
jgi:CBS domain-containing protein